MGSYAAHTVVLSVCLSAKFRHFRLIFHSVIVSRNLRKRPRITPPFERATRNRPWSNGWPQCTIASSRWNVALASHKRLPSFGFLPVPKGDRGN